MLLLPPLQQSNYSHLNTSNLSTTTIPRRTYLHELDQDQLNSPTYLSDSPSPVDLHPLSHPLSAPHSQDHFTTTSPYNKHPHHVSLLDHRRMSEPALFGNSYSTPTTHAAAGRYQQFHYAYNPSRSNNLHRGISTGSLRDLHHHHQFEYQQQQQPHLPHHHHHNINWKTEEEHSFHHTSEEPLSPLNPTFSTSPIQYPSVTAQDPYGPSPPGTGTSTSSNPPTIVNLHSNTSIHPSSLDRSDKHSRNQPNANNNSKTYSFVSLPGNAVKKRPRRRYDEIERLYQCSWPDCNKAYGTLNHLNAHVTMQKHGQKRSPNEFKELRKQWRKAKKESEDLSRPPRRDFVPHDSQQQQSVSYSHSLPSTSPIGTSVNVPTIDPNGRYSAVDMPIQDLRYPIDVHDRDRYSSHTDRVRDRDRDRDRESDQEHYLGGSVPISAAPRQRYPSSQWQPVRSMSNHAYTRLDPLSIPTQQLESSLPSNSVGRLTSDINRLPADSTLLTPIPGYRPPPPPQQPQQPPSLLPPLDERQQADQEEDPRSHVPYGRLRQDGENWD